MLASALSFQAEAGSPKRLKPRSVDLKARGRHASRYETAPWSRLTRPLSDRKYSGKFMVRVPPEVHRQLTIEAQEQKVSLNRLISAKLAKSA